MQSGVQKKIAAITAVCVAVGLCGWLAATSFSALTNANIKIALVELRSEAVQGMLLANARLSGDATANYYAAQMGFLRDKNMDTMEPSQTAASLAAERR
jgi:hypothetical protein